MAKERVAAAVLLDTPADPAVGESARLQREQPEDPAPHVKTRLISALQANLNLTNVHTVSDPLESDEVKTLKDVFKTGVVLDVRTVRWGRDGYRGYYTVRARMVRLEDSSVLWKTTCSARWANDWKQPLAAQLRMASDDCAAQLSAKVLGKDPKPVAVTGHVIPAEGLPTVPGIVADEHSIELPGLEMTPEERALFEEQRSARIDSRTKMSFGIGGADPRVIVLCAFFLPVCVAVGAVTIAVVQGIRRTVASAREPSLIPEQKSMRLAAMLKEQATGASLAERMARLSDSASVPAATEAAPRLVVRMKLAQPDYSGKRTGVSIVAQAQAFPSAGPEWQPTEHRYEFSSLAWTANDAELVRREIDDAVDALADSIWSAYSPRLPDGTVEEPGKPVEATGPVVEDVRQLAHQQH